MKKLLELTDAKTGESFSIDVTNVKSAYASVAFDYAEGRTVVFRTDEDQTTMWDGPEDRITECRQIKETAQQIAQRLFDLFTEPVR